MQDIISELTWRGLIHQTTEPAPEMATWLNEKSRTLYAGFDPTADSLHVGSLLPLLMLRRFQRAGHRPIALIGGATGMIGDPSGKSEERNLLSEEVLQNNVDALEKQMQKFLDFLNPVTAAKLVNNTSWLSEFTYLRFLREVGKHFPVNTMLAKDSVSLRFARTRTAVVAKDSQGNVIAEQTAERESGISYTEFSYMLLQAYDFVHLYDEFGCQLQVGGSDQWGNITAGIDLGRRMHGFRLYGLTNPLLTKSDGGKMGKTESGTIWLSADRTSEFKFYQYWINISDEDVGKCLRFLTDLSRDEIEALDAERAVHPERRESQIKLAEELTKLVHSEISLNLAKRMTEAFFGETFSQFNWTEQQLLEICADFPTKQLSRSKLANEGFPLADAMCESGLSKSKSEARRTIQQGGAYVNGRRVTGVDTKLSTADLASETIMVLRSGKKSYALLRFTG